MARGESRVKILILDFSANVCVCIFCIFYSNKKQINIDGVCACNKFIAHLYKTPLLISMKMYKNCRKGFFIIMQRKVVIFEF